MCNLYNAPARNVLPEHFTARWRRGVTPEIPPSWPGGAA